MKETTAIANVFDGPKKPPRKIQGEQIKLDFAFSDDAGKIDAGIRETIRGVKLSIMAMGIALYRVDVSDLYIELGFKSFRAYIDNLVEETGMGKTSLYTWTYIGEAFVTHRADLERVGFSDADGPTKLPYLARALQNHVKKDVFKNIKSMSVREFEDWSRGEIVHNVNNVQNIKLKGSHLYVGDSPLISFAEDVSPQDRRYYEGILLEGAKAIQDNEYARLYRFYDEDEARRFDRIYQRELKALRTK